MKNVKSQTRRIDAEAQLIDLIKIDGSGSPSSSYDLKIDLIKSFFEMYDRLENTHHAECVQKLYFDKTHERKNLEGIAQDLYMDISTLRRYRHLYVKVILYVFNPPQNSSLRKIEEDFNRI